MRRMLPLLLVVGVLAAGHLPVAAAPSIVPSQEIPPPPELGAVVFEDPLTATGAVRAGACPTGRNTAEFVPTGYRLRVTGRCTETAANASQLVYVPGLTIADGEVAVEVSATDAAERVRVNLFARVQENGDGYSLRWEPTRGKAELLRITGQPAVLLAERADLATASDGGWERLALRMDGDALWGYVGDEPVIAVADGTYVTGRVAFGIGRIGDVDDETPAAFVLRNLRVAGLAEGDLARQPTYEPPAASGRAPSFVPPVGTPPEAGRVILEDSLAQGGPFLSVTCPTGRNSSRVVDEGLLIAVRGRCLDSLSFASIGPVVLGLTLADGEISIDFRVTGGGDRSVVALAARVQPGESGGLPGGAYAFAVVPNRGAAFILRSQAGQEPVFLAQRQDVGRLLRSDDWNTLSARLSGDALWLVINGQPVLVAQDGTFATGTAFVEVTRLGDANGDDEVAAVFRNLRVSAIEGASEERAPTYEQPSRPGSIQARGAGPGHGDR